LAGRWPRQGLNVLFLERGLPVSPFSGASNTGKLRKLLSLFRPDSVRRTWQPGNMESADHGEPGWPDRGVLCSDGKWTGRVVAVYGATLERLRREDFAATDHTRLDPVPLPNGWPIDYDEFISYYKKAEESPERAGTADPTDPDDNSVLRCPPPLSERDSHFFEAFAGAGFITISNYMSELTNKPGCVECQGVICPMGL